MLPSPLESIKNKCNWPGKRPNHWPGKRPSVRFEKTETPARFEPMPSKKHAGYSKPPYTQGSRRPENRTFQKCLPSPLESIKNESVQTTGHESVQTSRLSANTECFPSPLESIKTNCNWRRKRPNHWPRKRPNQPPALQQTTIYIGPRPTGKPERFKNASRHLWNP